MSFRLLEHPATPTLREGAVVKLLLGAWLGSVGVVVGCYISDAVTGEPWLWRVEVDGKICAFAEVEVEVIG